jgi:hypothetical protein
MAKAPKPAENKAFPEPKPAEIKEARAEGVKDAIRESTKDAYVSGANEGYGDDAAVTQRFTGVREVGHLQDLVDLPEDALDDLLNGKGDHARSGTLTEAQIAGLLEVERSGKNRTNIVKLMCKRLGIKSPYEVTSAGPAFTNDTTNVTPVA